ncbi:hypothetical protein H1R20_g3338, partial [Candolleomyces eurysporus]
MENIYAIAFGQSSVCFATHRNFEFEAPLVGFLEGVVTLHFMKKIPSLFDPYIVWGVRMFADFLVAKGMVLVIIWSG